MKDILEPLKFFKSVDRLICALAKNGHFLTKNKTFCASSFLNRFQKFQRIWDLWGMRYLCAELEKKNQNLTHPTV